MGTIGERIRKARQAKGLSQEELAQVINSTKSSISRYESGKRQPRLDQLHCIAVALGVHIFDLVGIGTDLDKIKIEYDRIEPISGNTEDLTPEKRSEIEKLISDPRRAYNEVSDKTKNEFWNIIAQAGGCLDIDNPRARINAALDQLPKEGQEKVATYAEDLIPRYRLEPTPQPPPAPQDATDTTPQSALDSTEGKDTTPPPEGAEGPQENH